MSGGKSGFVLSVRPRRYSITPQQKQFREASEYCGIRKGMSRADLVEAMTVCLPEYYRKKREQGPESPALLSQENHGETG